MNLYMLSMLLKADISLNQLAKMAGICYTKANRILNDVNVDGVEAFESIQMAFGKLDIYFDVYKAWPSVFGNSTVLLPLPDTYEGYEFEYLSERTEAIYSALDTLRPREKFVLVERWFNDKTQDECGLLLNVSKERIRQLENKALRKLRHHTRINKLFGFINDDPDLFRRTRR